MTPETSDPARVPGATTWFDGWSQVLVGFLIQSASIGAAIYAYGVAAVSFAEAFEPSRMVLMLGVTAQIAVSGVIAPWLGAAIDRYPMRLVMLTGVLCLVTGFAAMSFATSMWQVLVCYGLFISVATTLAGPLASSTLLSRWFIQRRSLALGIAAIGTSLGGLVMPPLLQWLIDSFEWRMAFRMLSGILLLATAPFILRLVIDRPEDRGLHPDGADASPDDTDGTRAQQAARFNSTAALLRSREFCLIALVMSMLMGVYTGLLSNLAPFSVDLGMTPARSAMLLSLIALAGVAGKLGFGALGDQLDLRLALGGTIIGICCGIGCFVVADSYLWLAVGSTFLGLAAGGMLPIWGAIIGKAFGPDNYGRVMGLMTSPITVLSLIAPPLAGHAHDVTGSYGPAFYLFLALLVAVLVALPFIRVPHGRAARG